VITSPSPVELLRTVRTGLEANVAPSVTEPAAAADYADPDTPGPDLSASRSLTSSRPQRE
jgi:hypothetical protein